MAQLFLILVLVPAADDELATALKAVREAKSYAFTVKDGVGTASEGTYQMGVPVRIVADGIEFYRQADVLVYRQGDAWQRTRTGTLSDPLRILGASAKVKAAALPHEELGRISAGMTDVQKTAGKEGATYSAQLPAKAAKELAHAEDRDLAQD